MASLDPYQYDGYVIKEIAYGDKAKKEVLEFSIYAEEEYKLVFGKTVLAKALRAARLGFDKNEAHSAIYDAKQTAELFCYIVNGYRNSKQ